MPGGTGSAVKQERLTTHPGSDLRQLEIQYNNLVADVQALLQGQISDQMFGFYGVGPNTAGVPLAIGSTTSRVGTAAMTFAIGGVPVTKAVDDAGTAFGGLGTIPTGTWGAIGIDVVAAGTVTYASSPANYTTGYTTEALAIAALPTRTTLKARAGYVTILAASPGFVVGTDALSGSSATTVNYYPLGSATPTGVALNANGVVSCANLWSGTANVFHPAWIGGRNGVQVGTVMARGSTDTRVSTTAFIYNCGGLSNVPKAADTTGTAFAASTIPADKWGIVAFLIDGAGTKSFLYGPSNTVTGYGSEQQAIADLGNMYPGANKCYYGYVTIKTKAATAFIFATDGLAGGSSGNVASATNYYPVPSYVPVIGGSAALLSNREGRVLAASNY